jgi:hypothetical protein
MTIIPTVPAIRQVFTIEVKSAAAYVDVSLVVSGSNPRYNGVKRCGNYYCWRWEDSWDIGGTYTYSFKIKSGAATCVSKAVTVTAPTDTPTVTPSPTITPSPTPSPTPTPFYDFQVLLNGNPNGYIAPGGEQTFDVNLTNLGNREDVYNVWLQLDEPPPGQIANWTVQYCVGDTCYDYTVPNASVTVPAGSTQLLHIKFRAADDAPLALVVKTTIKVQSQTNLGVIRGTSAQVTVIQQ